LLRCVRRSAANRQARILPAADKALSCVSLFSKTRYSARYEVPSFNNPLTATDARFAAQRIAFAPVVFQVVQVMRRTGLLRTLVAAGTG
jgi:hypothetical protein